MKLLLDRIKNSCAELEKRAGAKENEHQMILLQDIRNALNDEELTRNLREDIQIFGSFKNGKITVTPPDTTVIQSKLGQLTKNSNPEKQGKLYFDLVADLKFFERALRDELKNSWSIYVESNTVPVGGIHSNLGRIPEYGKIINSITQIKSAIESLSQYLPKGDKDIKNFHELNGKLRDAWDEFERKCPQRIREFVIECATSGATLSSLNDTTIRNWMKTYELETSFCVKFKEVDG